MTSGKKERWGLSSRKILLIGVIALFCLQLFGLYQTHSGIGGGGGGSGDDSPLRALLESSKISESASSMQQPEKQRLKLAIVVAVRPNYMKAAPILLEIQRQQQKLDWDVQLIHTGQHFDKSMSDVFFEQLHMPHPTVNLNVGLAGAGSNGGSTDAMDQMMDTQAKLKDQFTADRPDLVMVIGDVSSTLACAYAAWGLRIPIVHLESGLRSGDLTLPEEMNRIVTDHMSSYFFVTEPSGVQHLTEEGIVRPGMADHNRRLFYIGNPMIDTILHALNETASYNALEKCNVKENEYLLVTFHRQDNVDTQTSLAEVLVLLRRVSQIAPVILSVHPRTLARLKSFQMLDELEALAPAVQQYSSLSYIDFIHLEKNAMLVLTDSGGVQEETTALNVPCITARPSTERPTTVTQGTNYVIPRPEVDQIVALVEEAKLGRWQKAGRVPLYWDGSAGARAVAALDKIFRHGVRTVQDVPLGSEFPRLGGKRFLILPLDASGLISRGISGSFLWFYNIIRALLADLDSHVDVFSTAPINTTNNIRCDMITLLDRATVLDPHSNIFDKMQKKFKKGTTLSAEDVNKVVSHLDSIYCYDLIIWRNQNRPDYLKALHANKKTRPLLHKVWAHSFDNSTTALAKQYGATAVLQSPLQLTGGGPYDPKVHTDRHREIWIPPMIENVARTGPRVLSKPGEGTIRFCHIGAWYPYFFLAEALNGICQLIEEHKPGTFSFLFVFGTEFPPQEFLNKAKTCPGVTVTTTPISPKEAMDHYVKKCDIGIRGLEIPKHAFHVSTKVIEMASTGLPILMNRFPVHEQLVGPDYPLWWDEKSPTSSFIDLVKKMVNDPDTYYTAASAAVLQMAQGFTREVIAAPWGDLIAQLEPEARKTCAEQYPKRSD